MGVTGGAAAVKAVHGPKVNLSTAGRGIAAVDMSHWLVHIGTSSSELANRFHMQPKVPLYDLIFTQLKQRIDSCTALGIMLIFVFDNSRNPLKEDENLRRSAERTKAEALLMETWISAETYDESAVIKLKKRTFYIRDDIIYSTLLVLKHLKQAYIFAPLEADPQVVSLQLLKQVDFIFSDDSDILFHGGLKVIMDLSFHNGMCFIITQAHVIEAMKRLALPVAQDKVTVESLSAYATFMGNDFIKTFPHKAQLFSAFVNATTTEGKRDVIIKACTVSVIIEESKSENKSKKRKIGTEVLDNSLLEMFLKTYHYFSHAAVFKFKLHTTFVTKDSAQQFLNGEYDVTLEPLNAFDHHLVNLFTPPTIFEKVVGFSATTKWLRMIGHEPIIEIYKSIGSIVPRVTLKDIATCKVWSRSGQKFKEMALPKPVNSTGNSLPWSSIIYFTYSKLYQCTIMYSGQSIGS